MNGFVEINEDLEMLGRPKTLLVYTSSRELEIQWTGWVVHKRTIHPPSSKSSLWSRPDFQLPVMPLFPIIWILSVKHCVVISQPIVGSGTGRNYILVLPRHQPSGSPGLICKMSQWPKWSLRSFPTLTVSALSVKHPRLGRTLILTIVSYYPVFRAILCALDQLAG